MINFKLEIQESERLVAKGIVCIVRSDGKRIYCRLAKDGNEISLIPLTKEELVKAEIQESDQTANSEFWDIEVSESEHLPSGEELAKRFEDERKKKTQIPLQTVEDAEKMRLIAEKAKEILSAKTPSVEELQAELQDKTLKLEIIASRELNRRMDILSIPENSDLRAKIRENPSILTGYEQRVKEEMLSDGKISEGSAPLNKFQLGQNAQGFANVEEMIKDLRTRAKSGDASAEAILKKLFVKMVQGLKERGSTELPFEIANSKSKETNENVRAIEVSINAPKDPNQESELEKFGIGKKKKFGGIYTFYDGEK